MDKFLPRQKAATKKLIDKSKEALIAVLPITLVVSLLSVTFAPVDLGIIAQFFLGAFMLVQGMGLFTLGADMAMLPMGEYMGSHLTRKRNIYFLCGFAFLLGVLITIAEPDLTVLANQIQGVPNFTLILTVGVGVGSFLVVALLRILFRIKLKYMLLGLYALVFLIGIFIKPEFLPMSFDSGGVTTGPITVPFILALGMGVANVRSGKEAEDDSFGLVALCSVGPILAIMLISLFFPELKNTSAAGDTVLPENTLEVMSSFSNEFPHYLKEVLIALLPIVVLFIFFQFFSLHLPGRELRRISVGLMYTFLGLVIFLTGVNVGFLPMGQYLGAHLATEHAWLLIPLGALIGFLVVRAEPAVHVLNSQVEEVSSGAISKKAMMYALSIGVAASVSLSMLRVLTGISIWYFIAPGYLIALLLTFFCPPIFTAIAFDSGGVASGPLTAAFMLPLAMGACGAVGGNVLEDAFGVVAMVAMTPLIAIQILGVVYRVKTRQDQAQPQPEEEEIIDV
ncbi:MAG: DUF1538 domain-containing protein [Clostridia bacterium]|nr:DUF1538 domain-containing protein [Clostridia bacterium]